MVSIHRKLGSEAELGHSSMGYEKSRQRLNCSAHRYFFYLLLIYLIIWEADWKKTGKQIEQHIERAPTRWFTPQMPVIAWYE